MKGTSPMQLSLKYLRKNEAWMATPVEYYNAILKRRKDLWGFADIIFCTEAGIIGFVQTTTRDNISARVNKIMENQNAVELMCRKVPIKVHGWYKEKQFPKEGKGAVVWKVKERELSL